MMSRTAGMFHKLLKLIRNVRVRRCTQASILEWIPDHMLVFPPFSLTLRSFKWERYETFPPPTLAPYSLTDKLGWDTRGDHLFYLEVQDDSLNNGAHVAPDERGGNNRVP